ncbi:40S ribosomal protein S3a [Hondaea fermentalgiana]|uniref:Small ribosomal subunit protein eS1 n=1 Tax=Hondaea fermentalgiana TaxID=2315210 RepID=A0A2R5GJN0_9STRA|nr:40S ribosomal protein S3a [Hondaea fermentalgiana]|eukprot:GBG31087.1 40S ribosomal protein S3a [Hondaea fermentalgiana]
MAVGKNRKLGKKGKKKKVVDPFTRKDWYTVKAPSVFTVRDAGKSPCTRTTGTKIASEQIKGRIFEVSLADLQKNPDMGHIKIKLAAEDVQGDNVLTTFHGLSLTRDKLCSLIKKRVTLIEGRVDVRTTDGYTVRLFAITFTRKQRNSMAKTCYCQSGQARQIRAKMVQVIQDEAAKCDLKELVAKLLPETIGKEIEKAVEGIFPCRDAAIRKVKILKKPRFDLSRLMEQHADTGADVGAAVDREDPAVAEELLAGSGGRL